jgi:hypothetical protein
MKSAMHSRHDNHNQVATHAEEPGPTEIVPFGRYGGGLWTGHPIGLLIVVGLLAMGWVGLPEFRVFFAASLIVGGAFGFILWRHHR